MKIIININNLSSQSNVKKTVDKYHLNEWQMNSKDRESSGLKKRQLYQ